MEVLTKNIARAYRDRAKALPYNGIQDTGERRILRQELQERYGVTELEVVNILNGFNIADYCMKYLIKAERQAWEKMEVKKLNEQKQSK